jgi:signal peptidase II
MAKPYRSRSSWRDLFFGGVILLVVAADQLTKWWITGWWEKTMPPDGVLWNGGFVQIIYLQNTGAAFGIFRGFNLIFIIVYLIILAVFVTLIIKYHNNRYVANSLIARLVVGLILGGMIGNLTDRLRIGHVTDFIDFKVWPAFNVADSSLVLAMIIVVVYLIFFSGRLTQPGE